MGSSNSRFTRLIRAVKKRVYRDLMNRRKSVASGPNKGTRYEVQIFQILEKVRLLPEGVIPAGASDKPDVYFLCQSDEYPLEIKDPSGDFAQIELSWNPKQKFLYSSKSKNSKFIPLLEQANFLEEINRKWKPLTRLINKKAYFSLSFFLPPCLV
jgi:hypothetical protein